jgi:hypothetical protein
MEAIIHGAAQQHGQPVNASSALIRSVARAGSQQEPQSVDRIPQMADLSDLPLRLAMIPSRRNPRRYRTTAVPTLPDIDTRRRAKADAGSGLNHRTTRTQ